MLDVRRGETREGKMGLLFNENEIPIKNNLGLIQMIK